jgi:uncharacterized SAM-binding protein YcdF (DUF218 family)
MSVFNVFIPHVLGVVGAILWLLVFARLAEHRTMLIVVMSLPAYALLVLILVRLTPSPLMRAKPTRDQEANTAVILGFGFVMVGGQMRPGEANQFLLDWTIENKSSQVKTILVQEGIWVASDAGTLEKLGITRKRIHQHDPEIYVNTLDTAFCAIQQLQQLGKKKAMLVAHDLQLQRVAWDFERVSQEMHPECTFVIPNIPDTPYPANSVHYQTRNECIYKIAELFISRPKDFFSPIPIECKAPLNSKYE